MTSFASQQRIGSTVSGEIFLNFIVNHSVTIIQVLVTLIVLLTSYILYRIYSNSSEVAVNGTSTSLSPNLDEALAKLAELQKSASAPAAEATPEVEALREDLIKSKNIIKELEQKIQDLSAAASTPAADPAETEALRTKLADLEGRLSEYEIIAEDIADLGRFKEENIKLKKEIEDLKNGGVSQAKPASQEVSDAPVSTEISATADLTSQIDSEKPTRVTTDADNSSINVEDLAKQAAAPEPVPPPPTTLSDVNVEEAFSQFANSVVSDTTSVESSTASQLAENEKPIDKATFEATAAPPVGETVEMSPTPPPRDENEYQEELLNEFEGFIKKK